MLADTTLAISPDLEQKKQTYLLPMLVMGLIYFLMGYITWTNGPLIPYLKIVCHLETDVQAFFVTSAFYFSFFFMPIPSAWVLKKSGFRNGMIVALFIIAAGSILFIPAADTRTYGLFLAALFMQGSGLALLQTAVNPYVSILGPIQSAARRISIVGIANKSAGIIAPLLVGGFILKGASDLEKQLAGTLKPGQKDLLLAEMAHRVQVPYIALAIIVLVVAAVIYFSKLPEIAAESGENPNSSKERSLLGTPHLMLGVLAIVFYVGAEVIAGDGIGQYGKNIGISLNDARHFTSYTMAAMLLGYLVGIIAIPRFLKQEDALKYSAITGIVFCLCVFFTKGYTSVFFIALLGLANALMWPSIFPLAIMGLGNKTKMASALLIMGIGPGGGLIPLLYAFIGGQTEPQRGFLVIIGCYLYILFYALRGHKIKVKPQ
ncbi:glucose/galactose transporter [Mucilaginibacter oryzae]|uniref:Glucose/galactose transporter n=1 Tax=Mucilaginibacter oryzae TaxID=468058 RepID=A0A316GSE4_9SPHI|nr:sugar MFS transporter [Mucilaginibacter oryzae]PWK65254.1 glucose/galactose transporter [Mucilaginibacter oryzae]